MATVVGAWQEAEETVFEPRAGGLRAISTKEERGAGTMEAIPTLDIVPKSGDRVDSKGGGGAREEDGGASVERIALMAREAE